MKMTDRFLALAKATSLAAISVFLPAGCGDEVQTPGDIVDDMNNAGTGTGREVVVEEPRRAMFSSGGDVGTRTSLDTALNFYWEPGDKILVNINGTWTPNDSNSITGRTRAADFYFDGATQRGDSIHLNCGTTSGGFPVPDSTAWVQGASSCFAVVQPGRRNLQIRYYIQPATGNAFTIVKNIDERDYLVNGATFIRHKFSSLASGVVVLSQPYYYLQWGASSSFVGMVWKDYSDRYTMVPDTLEMTSPIDWVAVPNVNELYSYMEYGDPRWNRETIWADDNGNAWYMSGVWLKKKQYIPEFSSTVGKDGVDMRLVAMRHTVETTTYKSAGKPDDSVIDQYFFLPRRYDCGYAGYYWSRSPGPTSNPTGEDHVRGYAISFNASRIMLHELHRNKHACIVAPQWFK